MRALHHIERLWTAAKASIQSEAGATMTEYAVMIAGIALTVVAGLGFLGIGVGGAYSVDGILSRGALAFECKDGGWAGYKNPNTGDYFINQGQCMQYVNTGK